jgi:tetratricopeptide (TPR) repeat protein
MVPSHWLLVLILYCLSSQPVWAQFDQLLTAKQAPQAQSQQELDEYIEIFYTDTPQKGIQTIRAFLNHYPVSNLKGIGYQRLMLAYQEIGDYQGLIESGEKALKIQPENLNTLLTLADAIPNGVSGSGAGDSLRLAQAEQYARQIFEGIERIKLPRSMPRERWQKLSREMEASAHEALGHIASKRGHWQEAVAEFERAIEKNPSPQGRQFYRLGVAYMLAGRDQSAQQALRQAVELGPNEIKTMADAVLKRMTSAKDQ